MVLIAEDYGYSKMHDHARMPDVFDDLDFLEEVG